jgi:molybdopterin-containing oxidoreductase family iron-sulfur binding subunit
MAGSDRSDREALRTSLKLFQEGGEFGPPLESGGSRRDFLKLAGFALGGLAMAGCQRAPVQYALPLLEQPEGSVAGRPSFYASVCGGCSAGCGVLVKTRDGRPIKLEGNPDHPLSRGGLCAVGQASLLGLYDQQRLRQPLRGGSPAAWAAIDDDIRARLAAARANGRAVRFLTGPVLSPTTRALIRRFLAGFPDARQIVLDTRFPSAILDAHAQTHGVRRLPHYQLDRAEILVSFDADFLGTWVSPVEFTAAYRTRRHPRDAAPGMSYHVQFESRLSLTGSKADQRLAVAPADLGVVMSHLAVRLAQRAGDPLPAAGLAKCPVPDRFLNHLTNELWPTGQRRPSSLVLCGSQDVRLQILANFLNNVLGNYGATLDLTCPSHQAQGNDGEMATLLRELHEGQVEVLFVHQCNPVHDLLGSDMVGADLRRVRMLVCCSERLDETAQLAHVVCPVPHALESWGDAEPVSGVVSLMQPAINPLGNTRPLLESLAIWTGLPPGGRPPSAYELMRARWEAEVFPRRLGGGTFEEFWNQTLERGVAEVAPGSVDPVKAAATVAGLLGSGLGHGPLLAAATLVPDRAPPARVGNFNPGAVQFISGAGVPPADSFSLVLYPKVGMPDASHAYNPWLHELPDPISKVAWDNYACLSPAAADRLGVQDGDVIRLETPDAPALELPALVQPGQHDRVVAVALGYGSRLSERFANIGPPWLDARLSVGDDGRVGKNVAPLLIWDGGTLRLVREGVRLTKTGRQHALARTQSHDRPDRPSVRETTAQSRTPLPVVATEERLWPNDHETGGTRWGMVIDHNACTGCSACVIACQAENNIPVVGQDEVRRHREMHWLRLDRYYHEHDGRVDVLHQPMLCQHCANAPCEPVCPVLATVHSAEGLNQQVYNRCVGTRYCANNCPYKVRRFNWFDYAHEDTLQNLALNPEVTVRSRGVMEKCTFCVQRIQDAKAEANRLGRPLRDGDVQTACQQSCPAQAITFGNLKDRDSPVARQARDRRGYHVLEELNVRPAVTYLTLVRNRPVDLEGNAHG